MCDPYSCIVTQTVEVLAGADESKHDHDTIAEEHSLADICCGRLRTWCRVECHPRNGTYASDTRDWLVVLDEWGRPPDWWVSRLEQIERKVRAAARRWQAEWVEEGVALEADGSWWWNEYRDGKLI